MWRRCGEVDENVSNRRLESFANRLLLGHSQSDSQVGQKVHFQIELLQSIHSMDSMDYGSGFSSTELVHATVQRREYGLGRGTKGAQDSLEGLSGRSTKCSRGLSKFSTPKNLLLTKLFLRNKVCYIIFSDVLIDFYSHRYYSLKFTNF